MKKYILSISFLLATCLVASGQLTDPLVSKCVKSTGSAAIYLKDFRVQLGPVSTGSDLRYKTNMPLWKDTKYRFSMCNSEDSKGDLILTIRDEANNDVLSSVDHETGKPRPYVDYICNKSGVYQLTYDFTGRQTGSGVGIVSLMR
ncbi:MAG: hypothetical protein R6W81_02670 [Bacteroidales bacterium]